MAKHSEEAAWRGSRADPAAPGERARVRLPDAAAARAVSRSRSARAPTCTSRRPASRSNGTRAISAISPGSMPPTAACRSARPRPCSRCARHAARLRPGARPLSRARADRERHLGADHRAAHRPLDRHLRAVLQAQADRRMVRRGGGPHRAGAAVRRAGDAGGPARLRPPISSRRRAAWAPAGWRRCAPSRCRSWRPASIRPRSSPSSPRSTSWWWRCSSRAPT